MAQDDKLPLLKNIPELRGNIEGLKRHSFLTVFIQEPAISQEERKLRTWLLHTVASAHRHYAKARELVELQENADQIRDGGAVFYILDVSEQIEDCVTALYRACMAIKRLEPSEVGLKFCTCHVDSINQLRDIRNQFDHMHTQITAAETGNGPISIVFGNEGATINFRKLSMPTLSLSVLIDDAYYVVASLFQGFDANSSKEMGGHMKLSISVTMSEIDENGVRRELT